MRPLFVIIIVMASSCSLTKEFQSFARNSKILSFDTDFKEKLQEAKLVRDDELEKLTVHLPNYDTIKDLKVLVDLSVQRINVKYDSTIQALWFKKMMEFKTFDSTLMSKSIKELKKELNKELKKL